MERRGARGMPTLPFGQKTLAGDCGENKRPILGEFIVENPKWGETVSWI